MADKLSRADIERLMSDPSEDSRADIAAKVAERFANVAVTPSERQIAHDILGYMVHDAAVLVRESLSKSLRNLPGAPHDIVMALARDIDDVAMPILEESPVLSEDDLIEIVVSGSVAKQKAIAARPRVEARLSAALVNTENRGVVAILVANDGAILDQVTFEKVVDQYGDDEEIADPLVRRADLPIVLAERLVTMVSDRLREYLIDRHAIDEDMARRLIEESRERSTIELVDGVDMDDMTRLVRQLNDNKRLTPTIMLRAACMGEMRFVEAGFGVLTGLPSPRVWRLIHDEGSLGFRAIYARAGIPEALYPAFRVALDVYQEMEFALEPSARARFRRRMLERILTQYEDLEAKDLDFLLNRLGRLATASSVGSAAPHAA